MAAASYINLVFIFIIYLLYLFLFLFIVTAHDWWKSTHMHSFIRAISPNCPNEKMHMCWFPSVVDCNYPGALASLYPFRKCSEKRLVWDISAHVHAFYAYIHMTSVFAWRCVTSCKDLWIILRCTCPLYYMFICNYACWRHGWPWVYNFRIFEVSTWFCNHAILLQIKKTCEWIGTCTFPF